ncbi:response regulator transcription factor [Labrys sp. KNU-23]|uniref:LuxR C-terminal-related transcriptional regulator n=1 Tax=Labrys sp. KNU-23 TaxID=2789216 RepID=UPI0011EFF3E6|nr:response regulator transcription factor [Labrys sp. KNU-23]QEN86044.1 response regulator transcription factor [Labrys sp. KNU-23]
MRLIEYGQFTRVTRETISDLVVIDKNNLSLTCISSALAGYCSEFRVSAYKTASEWKQAALYSAESIVLLCVTDQREPANLVADIQSVASGVRIIVVSHVTTTTTILAALGNGARGYIPDNASLDVVVGAIRLVRAGGIFVPADSLMRSCEQAQPDKPVQLTKRQLAIIERLRKGESNKIIADKLDMKVNTVKVHVRNIMQKIKARNRTEIAYLTNHLFEEA